ncbi:hypothetical protein Agub_g15370 [Astrephomene gubernaculifera]|uniref:Holocytochrome c-type synthase n=1 Tax=Astrephomene gubernaculifera TaxID=47775 RepID=A0AAD3HTP0_9CHLO|nr:hypothetical protein Agub_g15370 [Astrephomene gubernaculifera]
MVESSETGGAAARSTRLFAKYSSTLYSSSGDSTECPVSASPSAAAVGAPANGATPSAGPSRPQQTPSGCSYAAAASTSSSPLPSGGCPVQSPSSSSPSADGGTLNPLNNIPASLSAMPPEVPGLSAQRQTSNIPMSPPDKLPPHQQSGQDFWVYPSEQMFFNAMKRKGWDPQADDMRSVVAIHNSVNERAWREVMAWERLHCQECAEPRLKRFQGRPSDLSPKARLLNFMGFGLPFDRHDWVVDRCGKEVRYIIDFYNGAPQPGQRAAAAFFLDVRPALDSFEAAWDRVRMQLSWVTSGRWRD